MSEITPARDAAGAAPYAPPTPPPSRNVSTPSGPGNAFVAQPLPVTVRKKRRGMSLGVTNIILLCVLALVTLGTLAFFAASIGINVFLICGALALIPLGICVTALRWIDHWEPEPLTAVILAFCWGAGMSVITTLMLGSWVQPYLMGASMADPDIVGAVVQAPLVEEICKGAGVLLLFFVRRRTFDGPIDGLVYAGMIAAGFAFTENILYFGQALVEAQGAASGLVAIFVVRGMMSPFAHVMFTAMLGICVGWAARYGNTKTVFLAWFGGLIPAMLLHGLWNVSSFLGNGFFVAYLVLQVPLFILFIVGIALLRRSEAKLTRERLADYVPYGWFTPAEVPMLATGAGRRRALAWSRSFAAAGTMKEFIRLATRLAFTRQRLIVDAKGGPAGTAADRFAAGQAQESRLLAELVAVRNELLARHAAALPH